MAEPETRRQWSPRQTRLVAGGIVIAGFWLASLSWWYFLLVPLGAFGPGILREMDWLHDKDEFQRRADHRAGYHAFLVCGLVAGGLVAVFRSEERTVKDLQELASLFLALLWFTWFLSSVLSYWGPHRATAWILRVFGSVVLVFTVVSNLGAEWTGWAALLLHPLLAAPFFVLAWLAGRWPRTSGVLLLAAAVFFTLYFGMFRREVGAVSDGVTFILFIGPLLAGGVALLGAGKQDRLED